MSFQDQSIQCCDCGHTFIFSADAQEFQRAEGYSSQPKRCSSCRAKKKMQRYGDGDYGYRSRSWSKRQADMPKMANDTSKLSLLGKDHYPVMIVKANARWSAITQAR